MGKTLLAGILGGLVLFAWGAVAHMALPLGTSGMREIVPAQEAALGAALQASCTERAIYLFPHFDLDAKPTPEQEELFAARYDAGPAALIVYQPDPGAPMSGRRLGTQLAIDLASAILVAVLAWHFGGRVTYLGKVGLIGSVGLVNVLCIVAPYWNWYGFPTAFLLGSSVEQLVGWLLAGLVIGKLCRT
jgi:hypothetical protein